VSRCASVGAFGGDTHCQTDSLMVVPEGLFQTSPVERPCCRGKSSAPTHEQSMCELLMHVRSPSPADRFNLRQLQAAHASTTEHSSTTRTALAEQPIGLEQCFPLTINPQMVLLVMSFQPCKQCALQSLKVKPTRMQVLSSMLLAESSRLLQQLSTWVVDSD
jgi:hypothetical protein